MSPASNKVAFIGLLACLAMSGGSLEAKAPAPAAGAKAAPASAGKSPAATAMPGAAGYSGYRVEATSNYAGTLSCQMCKEGIRVKSDRMGLTWILTAPKWNAQIYNTSTECYMDLPYNDWTKRQSFIPMAKKKATLKLEKTKNTKVMHGLNTRQYLIMATFQPGAPGFPGAQSMPGMPGASGSAAAAQKKGKQPARADALKPVTVREAEMWVAKDPCVPKQFNELMGKIFGIPAEDGLPLSISLRQKNGKITSIWETVKLTKSNIAKDEFKPIVGYKKVKTEVEMMLGDQDLGLSESDGLDAKPVKRPRLDEMP